MDLREWVWQGIHAVAIAHDAIEAAAAGAGLPLSDKGLHFLVFGAVGALVLLVSWGIAACLRRHPGVLAFFFTLTLMALLALAVEVGQQLSGASRMDLYDVAAGLVGVLAFCGAAGLAAAPILWLLRRRRRPRR